MNATDLQTFPCPACGTHNSELAWRVRQHGLQCRQCGVGYMPVKIETRAKGMAGPPEQLSAFAVVGFVILALLLVVFLFGIFGALSLLWSVGPVIGLGLLALILVQVSRLAKK